MNRTITSLIFVCAFVLCAGTVSGVSATKFTTGTSFENQATGPFDPALDDTGGKSGDKYWTAADTNGMTVAEYGAGEAYDYAAKGTKRNALFDDEPAKGTPGTNKLYLALSVEDPLERCVMPLDGGAISNVMLQGGIYSDTLVQFTTSYSAPAISNADKIAVWLRERESDDGTAETNLMITAGYFAGGFDKVVARDYALTNLVAEGAWCRITIRAVTNITSWADWNTPGFVVYVDGKPAAFEGERGGNGEIGEGYREDRLTPEARMLCGERRLFPWLAPGYDDRARSLSRFAFAGQGAADDVSFSTERPEHVVVDNVFTLRWDAGVTSMRCIVSNATAVVTNDIDAAANAQRCCDFALGTNNYARVTVTNVVYDAAHEYTNGNWKAENDCTTNDCTATSGVFVYKGKSTNPIGIVASSRPYIGVGTDGCETFAEAKARAKKMGQRTLMLMTNVVITRGLKSEKYNDKGMFSVGAGDDIILDLNGKTLRGSNGEGKATIDQTDGTLTIIDSAGGGAVLPPDGKTVAVKSSRGEDAVNPMLIIEAGRYDGEVCVTGRVSTAVTQEVLCAACRIGGGSFTNVFGAANFYLEQYVTNTSAYYALDATNYWSIAAEDAFVWCGEGSDAKWTTAKNWKGGEAPDAADDLAIFPRRADATPWAVDFGAGVAVKRLWLDADVAMSGTNEFSDVAIEKGDGRFAGSGTMTFTGTLPGNLANARLSSDWKGTVLISKITSPTILSDIDAWGVEGSKVEFAGVRGYVSDKSSHALPYELVLTDDGDTPAWKNETGYFGSTISFPRLTGSGTFSSPKTLRDVAQVFRFSDVADFTGAFEIGSKKLVLGEGSAASGSKAGSFTFADSVRVQSGLGWSGVSAFFGKTLAVDGALGETLLAYSGDAPAVEHVVVTLCDRTTGAVTTNTLTAADGAVRIGDVVVALLDGDPVSEVGLREKLKAGSVIEIPAGAAVTVVGGRKIGNGYILPDYYKLTSLGLSASSFAVSFDEEKATPSLADFEVASDTGTAVITVTNAKPGLWYGLRSVSSLAGDWAGAKVEWKLATDSTVTFAPDTSGASAFYQVIMTDKNPNGGAQ